MESVKSYPSGTHLCAAYEDANGLGHAKEYCRVHNLTPDDVKIIRKGELIIVVRK